MGLTYEGASWKTVASGCQPGTMTVAQALTEVWEGMEVMSGPYGCFADRAIRGSRSPSLHREGRALDVGVPSYWRADDSLGWLLACHLCELAPWIGTQQVVWDRHSWRIDRPVASRWRRLSRGSDQHIDHIHWEQRWKWAKDRPTDAAYRMRALRDRDGR